MIRRRAGNALLAVFVAAMLTLAGFGPALPLQAIAIIGLLGVAAGFLGGFLTHREG